MRRTLAALHHSTTCHHTVISLRVISMSMRIVTADFAVSHASEVAQTSFDIFW
jgi:hypothetical protein